MAMATWTSWESPMPGRRRDWTSGSTRGPRAAELPRRAEHHVESQLLLSAADQHRDALARLVLPERPLEVLGLVGAGLAEPDDNVAGAHTGLLGRPILSDLGNRNARPRRAHVAHNAEPRSLGTVAGRQRCG